MTVINKDFFSYRPLNGENSIRDARRQVNHDDEQDVGTKTTTAVYKRDKYNNKRVSNWHTHKSSKYLYCHFHYFIIIMHIYSVNICKLYANVSD